MKKTALISRTLAFLFSLALVLTSLVPAFAGAEATKEDLDLITFDNVTSEDFLTILPVWGGAMSNSDKLALIQGGVAGNALQLTQSGTSGDFILKMAYKKVDGKAEFFDVSDYKYFRFWIKAPADKDVAGINFRLAGNYTGGSNNNEEAIAKTGTFYLKGTKNGEAYSASIDHTSMLLTVPAGFEGYVYTPMADFKTLYDGTTALANGVNHTRFVNFVMPTKNDGAVVVLDRLGFTDTDPIATVSRGTFMLIDFENQKQYNFLETQAAWAGAMSPAETMTLNGGYHGRGLHIVQDAAEKGGKIPDIAAMMAFRKDADNNRIWIDISGYKYLRFWVKTGTEDLANFSIRLQGYVGTTNNNTTAWLDGKNGFDLTFNGKKDGTTYTETVHQPGKMTLPANFEGYVYLPMTAFGSADLTSMSIINLVMPGSNNKNEIIFDEIAMTDDETTVAPGEATPDNSVDVEPSEEPEGEYNPGPAPTPTEDFIAFDFDKNSDDDFQTELAPWIPAPENWEQVWALENNFSLVPGGVTEDGKALQITQNRAAGDIAANIAFKKNGNGHDLVDVRGYKYFRVWIKTPECDEDGGMDYLSFRLKGIYNKNGKDDDTAAYLKCNTKCYLNGTLNGETYNGEFYNNTQSQSFVLPYNFEGYLYMPLDRFDLYENVDKDTEPSSIVMDRMKYLILVMPGSRAGRVSLWDDFRFTNTEPIIDEVDPVDPDNSDPEEPKTDPENPKDDNKGTEKDPVSPETGELSMVSPALAVMLLSGVVAFAVKRRIVRR